MEVVRHSGPDRYATAAAIARAAHPGGAPAVLVASGETFPDALAATALAGALGGPVLLAASTSAPAPTLEALRDLRPTQVVVVGGASRLPEQVVAELAAAAGAPARRLSGPDRAATAAAVAAELGQAGVADGARTALLATGSNFPDALAAGPVAAASSLPLLLTGRDALDPAAAQALRRSGAEQVVVLGGAASLSPAVEAAVAALGVSTLRLSGPDRSATAAAVADWSLSRGGLAPAGGGSGDGLDGDPDGPDSPDGLEEGSGAALARGDGAGGGADALALGPLAAALGEPVVLAEAPDRLGAPTARWLADHASTLERLDVAGGAGAVSPRTETALRTAAGDLAAVCTGLVGCRPVGAADVDGDGITDAVALLGPDDAPAGDLVVQTAQDPLAGDLPVGEGATRYLGAADLDGVAGAEVVLSAPEGPERDRHLVLRAAQGGMEVLLEPVSDRWPTSWTAGESSGETSGVECGPDDAVTFRTVRLGAEPGEDNATEATFERDGDGWALVGGRETHLPDADAGPAWRTWRCAGVTDR